MGDAEGYLVVVCAAGVSYGYWVMQRAAWWSRCRYLQGGEGQEYSGLVLQVVLGVAVQMSGWRESIAGLEQAAEWFCCHANPYSPPLLTTPLPTTPLPTTPVPTIPLLTTRLWV